MNKFSFYHASTLEEALEKVNTTVSSTIQPDAPDQAAVIKAGGIDFLDLMKEGLSKPEKIVSILDIPDLDKITWDDKDGLKMGANATLAEITTHEKIKSDFYALHQAASKAATPQIRNMTTLGGNLAQRTRCWYFRSKQHECFRKGSGTCFARYGENIYHAIMLNEDCASVHSSSLSTALMAFDAAVEIMGKDNKYKIIPIKDFFVLPSADSTRESVLEADQIITAIIIPVPKNNTKSHQI